MKVSFNHDFYADEIKQVAEFSPLDSEKNTLPKWQPISSTTKFEEEFQSYWKKNGETIVRYVE